jgi:hypothetical protein
MQMEANFHATYTDHMLLQKAGLLNYGVTSADTPRSFFLIPLS